MIEHVAVKNFQSLHDVSLKLDRFTVIVGRSSSGKSAFTRALKTLTGNARGDSFISHGENQCTLIAKTDRGTVALQRGKKNEYVLIPHEGEQRTYTKLAGTVPEEVSEFIGIPAKDSLNYANQFDMPYLLTASAAEVARTLGELTNVSVIFEASREANKRRLQASSTLKTRSADYQSLTGNLEKYHGLKAKEAAVAEAEEAVARAQQTQTRISGLTQILSTVSVSPEAVPLRDLPEVEPLKEQLQRLEALKSLTLIVRTQSTSIRSSETVAVQAETLSRELQQQYTEALTLAGSCPTCGQDTGHLTHG